MILLIALIILLSVGLTIFSSTHNGSLFDTFIITIIAIFLINFSILLYIIATEPLRVISKNKLKQTIKETHCVGSKCDTTYIYVFKPNK